MTVASDIVSTVGRKNLRTALAVGDTAITNALARGSFPARWYLVVQSECAKHGMECPSSLFGFVKVPAVRNAFIVRDADDAA
ncbi:hypothetical protein [Puniceibacterium confluentis]|uniref:hypothetical protein n=1 Tax=Puniceibacterium confluentis TaxID=1958944 RepID=UPI0011B48145|nr:hypothetical protein [Puniceibacterium confluentis]